MSVAGRVVGLTGGVATGKSTAAAMLRERGAVVVDADELARRVVEPGQPALDAIVAAFGPTALAADGTLDRSRLAALVFADASARARLEAITHPRIRALGDALVRAGQAAGAPVVVYDIPLLFEVGRAADVDGVLLVYAPPHLQLARLQRRDRLGPDEAARRLAAQWPIDRKRPLATWVIDNGGTRTATREQVEAWWRQVVGTAGDGRAG
ncbi:MAG TPA: dephospho-CoA kinase [Candidatus Micrarchaeia archaeon]|nr:dephospho-CoA kinase [Candidatus Micrarchaeia archaeon]